MSYKPNRETINNDFVKAHFHLYCNKNIIFYKKAKHLSSQRKEGGNHFFFFINVRFIFNFTSLSALEEPVSLSNFHGSAFLKLVYKLRKIISKILFMVSMYVTSVS